MKSIPVAAICSCAAILPYGATMRAQQPSANCVEWRCVQALRSGAELEILSDARPIVRGRVQSVGADGITVRSHDRVITINRPDVQQVTRLKSSRAARAKDGFLIGAGLGAAQALIATRSNRVPWTAFLASTWGGIGALIGAVSGAGGDRRGAVVYERSHTASASPERRERRAPSARTCRASSAISTARSG